MATKIVTKNSSTASAVPTASDLVQGELAVNVADKRLFTENNAGAIVELGTNPSTLTVTGEITANGGIALGDNDKATFGAGDDLQLYHNGGSGNYIDSVNKDLYIRCNLDAGVVGGDILLQPKAGENSAVFKDNGAVDLYYDNSLKLATTSTGIDVTGNVTMATGGSIVAGGANDLILNAGESGTPDIYLQSGGSTKVKVEGSNGNVGIGLTAPDAPLSVYSPSASANIKLTRAGTSENLQLGTYYINSTNNDLQLATTTSHPMVFKTNNLERMRIDSSGNVGIGTSSPSTKLHLGGTAPLDSIIRQDSTVSGTNWEIGEREAGKWQIFEDDSDSVVATFTSSGNVGIGNSSPPEMLTIGSTSDTNVRALFLSSTTGAGTIQFGDGTGASAYSGYINYTHSDNALAFATGSAERARLDSSGNLLVGRSSDSGLGKLQVYGGADIAGGDVYLARDTGNVLVGTTDVSASAGEGIKLRASSNAKTLSTVSSRSTSADEGITMWSTGANTWRFYVGWGGKINATSNTIQAISDQRFKENIRDLDDGLSKVMELRPRKFDWKEGKGADIKDDRGFIAQEFEEVFPDLVGEWKDEAPEGEEPYKAVSQDLIPTLVKAIQEQQTLIESLTTRIAALEE